MKKHYLQSIEQKLHCHLADGSQWRLEPAMRAVVCIDMNTCFKGHKTIR